MGFFSKVFSPVKSIVKSVIGVVSSVVKAVVDVAMSVVDFALQLFMPAMPDMSAASEANRQQGVLVQKQGSDLSIPVVYGHRKLGGNIVYMETGETNNKYLWVAYVFAEGLVEGVREIFIDDYQLDSKYISKLNGGDTVSVDEGKYSGRVRMRWSPGVYNTTPSSTLNNSVAADVFAGAPSFTSDMYFNGLATMFVRYEWFEINSQDDADNNPFTGQVPKLQVSMLGRRVATLVNSSSESYSFGTGSYVERYSTNPAECLLDYLRNPRYGKGLTNSEIDWDSFRTAASKLNTEVEYYAGKTGEICSCNAVLDTAQTLTNNVKLLLHGMRSYMPFVQGVYKLKVEDAGHPTDITSGVATISAIATTNPSVATTDISSAYMDIQGDIQYQGIERSSKYTQAIITYVDPQQGWSNQTVVYPETEAERQTYIALDGGRENTLQATMGTITSPYIAKDFARLMFNKSRNQESCQLTVSTRGMELEPGDIIRIQGTILNFDTTPWRIISLEYNDNYTVTLGCVRNAESIYPHTRLNEEDVISDLYRPGGSIIYPPSVPGADPPRYADYEDVGETVTNPPATDPDAGGDAELPPVVIDTPPPASEPPVVVQPKALDNTIDIDTITFNPDSSGQIYGTIKFLQPDHPQYAGVDIYYKIYNATNWTLKTITDKPGANKYITAEIGPLYLGTQPLYDIRTRVKYSTGEYSTLFTTSQFTASGTAGASQEIREFIQISENGWSELDTDTVTRRDDQIQVKATVASIGAVSDPRTISFAVSQNTIATAPNPDIAGYNVYWRAAADTYYERLEVSFSLSHIPGSIDTQTFAGDIGVVGGPTAYDFVWRLRYKDGTEGKYQWRKQIRTESPTATYPYESTYGLNSINELITAYNFQTVDQAPPGAVSSATDTVLGINYIKEETQNGVENIRLLLEPPDASDLDTYRGAKISYRPVVAGSNPPLKTFVDKQQKNAAGTIGPIYINNIVYDQKYEMIITPQVSSGGTTVNANVSLFGAGYVHNRSSSTNYPTDGNWLQSWNVRQLDTNVALSTSNQTFPAADPVVSVLSCDTFKSKDTTNYIYTTSTEHQLVEYVRLRFDKSNITGFQKAYIYRRFRSGEYTSASTAKYYGLGGQWEVIEVTDATHPPSGGITTVNLRGPISQTEFYPYYQVAGYESDPNYNNIKRPVPIINQGSKLPLETRVRNMEILIIVETTGATLSGKATHIDGINTHNFNNNWLTPNRPEVVDWTKYNTEYDTGYFRRLDEARTNQAVGNLAVQYNIPDATRPLSYPTTSPAIL